jgi:hypothetical protein
MGHVVTSSTDLPAGADTLSRAAAAIASAECECDPTPLVPLVPHLQAAADHAGQGYAYVAFPISALVEFARLVLGEEETP